MEIQINGGTVAEKVGLEGGDMCGPNLYPPLSLSLARWIGPGNTWRRLFL